ncbi:MAG: IS21 family transposase [Anaerolineaceae bacterium]|nr:IS21 family transposase [Anaerolineaceae bacterium]
MVNYREILRMSADGNYSIRQIKADAHCSHDTIKETMEAARAKGISWPLDDDVTNAELQYYLFPEKFASLPYYAMPDFAKIHRDLAKNGVNLTLLHEEYTNQCIVEGKVPYKYTQFCEKYRRWAKVSKATMRIQHKPGDKMEVDWAGDTLPIHEPLTGEISKGYLFVAALPCSFYVYAELCPDMKQENWLNCHINAYNYYGGVTRLLIPDNLKTGVIKNTRYDTVMNASYQDLAEYYDTAIVPCRVESPNDKSHAEGSVKFAETWILAALRDRTFFSFEEARTAVAEKLEELNLREIRNRKGWTRRKAFLEEEAPFLKALPTNPYELAIWLPPQNVNSGYLVSDGINLYSVPHDLIGKDVSVRITKNLVEIYFLGDRVAVHERKDTPQKYPVIKPEHMTEEHRAYLKYTKEDFAAWGRQIGRNTEKTVESFLNRGKEPEQGFKFCASLQSLAKRYSNARLEAACEMLLSYTSKPDIRTLSSILKNGQDKIQKAKVDQVQKPASSGITRGADYYRNLKGGAPEC